MEKIDVDCEQSRTPVRSGRVARPVINALALVCAAQFVLQLDFSIVNVALPTIERQLHFVAATLQWIVTGYALMFGSLLLPGGRVGDLLGRRRLLMLGLALFALASLLCGLAISPLMLILARFLQGAAAALVSPSALSLLTITHAEGTERNHALGIWQATTAAGASAGIIAGGILTQYLGWRAIFLVNVPIIVVLLLFIPHVLPDDRSVGSQHIDVTGAALVTASVAALIYGLSNGQQQGFGTIGTWLSLLIAVILAALFVAVERSSAAPMMPFTYFSAVIHRVAVGVLLVLGAVISAYAYFTSLYLQNVLQLNVLLTGLALVPSTGTIVITSTFLTRRLLSRLGVKGVMVLGLIVLGAGQLWLSFVASGGSYITTVLPGLLLSAFGIGLVLPGAAVSATSRVASHEQGLASGLLVTSQQIGSAVGLALLATLAVARTEQMHGSLASGYSLSYLVALGMILFAIVLVVTLLKWRT
jgi:MFS family permease